MNEFLQMDIFFFITTVVVLVGGALVCLVLYRVYRILGEVEHISKQVSAEADMLREDIGKFRSSVRQEGLQVRNLFRFFTTFRTARKRSKPEAPNQS